MIKQTNSDPKAEPAILNEVRLRGRVTGAPVERELPSGTKIVTFRVSVRRARTTMTSGSRQRADWVTCSVWTARLRRSASRWQVGDDVEITGSLRRRFQGGPGGYGTTVEIEVLAARRVGEGAAAGTAQSGGARSHRSAADPGP